MNSQEMNTRGWRYPAQWLAAVAVTASLLVAGLVGGARDVVAVPVGMSDAGAAPERLVRDTLVALLRQSDPEAVNAAVDVINKHWSPGLVPMLLESISYTGSPYAKVGLIGVLREHTGQEFGVWMDDWYHWLWNQPEHAASEYANFKADLYRAIDPRFDVYFRGRADSARIRLDEIRWGGVIRDGIPPLRKPQMISAAQATYLQGDNVVFGIEINGDARAYPKRILAWHEMFTDTIGGEPIAGVYCTLCGTVIPYKTTFNGKTHALGTSGFLYRSNKLMYDQATESLWNTLRGEPVLGPLVDQGIALEHLSVVTTTWAEWVRRHPNTTVLARQTGHARDYGEGVAYQDYFADDQLMFQTPFDDTRLANKQEVLALRFAAAPKQQLAIDTAFLDRHPLYLDRVGQQAVLVLTDSTGANRVYDPGPHTFVKYDRDVSVTDETGAVWRLGEEWLTSPDGARQHRLPYHRAFWFGWHATFPETRLVK